MSTSKTSVIVLAAGMGKRMGSRLPKVLVPICGRPMVLTVLDRLAEVIPYSRVAVVVGYEKEKVTDAVLAQNYPLEISFIEQVSQHGTGDAVKSAMSSEWGARAVELKETVMVFPGDLPLISNELVSDMAVPLKQASAMRLLAATLPDPTGYGRVIRRGKKGAVLRIVEEKDANAREKLVQEVGVSIYSFQARFLKTSVEALKTNNAQKEYYLTDLVKMAVARKRTIETKMCEVIDDVRGVNNPYELALACEILNTRVIRKWAMLGVRFMDLKSVRVDPSVEIASGVTIYPGVILEGICQIGTETVLGPNVYLKDTQVGERTLIKAGSVVESSTIADDVQLGPYAHLRPGSEVGSRSKIGNFVELKKSRIGEATSIAHLSYLGDAEVGKDVNIGCGFVTCNFDGRVIDGQRKHKTIIEDEVFVGSDCQTVAPVTLKKGAYVASGSTITKTVEAGDLAIARSRQVNKPGYAKRLRPSK